MPLTRRAMLAAGAAVPFLRSPARAALTKGKLIFGLSSFPPTMNPWLNAGTASATAKLAFQRGLLGYAPDGTIRGELAEKWEHTEDGAWVFHLRDAVFHNGAKVTSADVAWTIEQIAEPKSTAYLRTQMQDVSKVETPDAKTVRIFTKQPSATLPVLFAMTYLPIVAKGSTKDDPLGVNAGPFVLADQERGVSLTFKAFDKYYKPGLPKLQELRMIAYKDENLRVAALQAGDVDLIEYVPWQSFGAIEGDAKLAMETTFGPFMYLTFNAKAGPFGDPRVRNAIAYAVKRDDVVKAAFFGRGEALGGLPISDKTPFYDKALATHWTYDPTKAKALLAEAGHKDGFTCKLLSTAQYGMHKDTATVVQQNLADIGIQCELVLPDWATRVALGNKGQFEFAVMGSAADGNDPEALSNFLDGRLSPAYSRSYALDVPAIDKALDAGRAEFDETKRVAIYKDLQQAFLDSAPFVSLCSRAQAYAMNKGVTGFSNLPGQLTFYSGSTFETTSTG